MVDARRYIFFAARTVTEGVIGVGIEVETAVDANHRQRAKETAQACSLVAFDRLRFDFNFSQPVREHELMEIEQLINQWVGDATFLEIKVMPFTEAKRARAIAMFGEKYGEHVRVVDVSGVSMDQFGGTHVRNTCEIRDSR